MCFGILLVLGVFRDSVLQILLLLQVFWGPILRGLLVLAVFGPLVLLILPVIRSTQAANTLILSVLGVRNVFDTPRILPSILGESSTLGAYVHHYKTRPSLLPGSGVYSISHFADASIAWKYNESILEKNYLRYFVYSQYFGVQYSRYWSTPSISQLDTAGTACTRG